MHRTLSVRMPQSISTPYQIVHPSSERIAEWYALLVCTPHEKYISVPPLKVDGII